MNEMAEAIIFENQNILPSQFFPRRRDTVGMDALLAVAVLVDAVRVFQTNFDALRPSRKREFNEAREWLLGPPGRGPFAFENVCSLLNVDPSRLRSWLGRWQALKRSGLLCGALARRTGAQHRLSLCVPALQLDPEWSRVAAKCRKIRR